VRCWHREGLLCAGQHLGHPLTWMGEPTEGIGVLVKADAVVLFRSRRWGGGYGEFITQRVPVTWTLCALGGRRPWFRCDVYSRDRYCGRRVALLHSAGGLFACRHCRGLVYASQQEPKIRLTLADQSARAADLRIREHHLPKLPRDSRRPACTSCSRTL
jgi:hypothetical protein